MNRERTDDMELLTRIELVKLLQKYWKNTDYISTLSKEKQMTYDNAVNKLRIEINRTAGYYACETIEGFLYIDSPVLIQKVNDIIRDNCKEILSLVYDESRNLDKLDAFLQKQSEEFCEFYLSNRSVAC